MIPVNDFLYENENPDKVNEKEPDLAWKIEKDRMQGKVDKLNAVIQSSIKRLNTENGVYEIYSENYGLKTVDLVGKDKDYAVITLKRRITESLLFDERILTVDFLESVVNERKITLYFEVLSIYGSFNLERSLKICR